MPSEIEVSCPGCNAVFSVPVELAGEAAECSECAAVFEIPRIDERPDAIDTDTGVIKGVAPAAGDYTSTATNTVKLSRSSIGMIPTLKDSFTFGNKAPGAGLGAQPPPPPPPPAAPQPSAWGAQPGMQPRMAPPPPVPQATVPQPPPPRPAAPPPPPPRPAAPAPQAAPQQRMAPPPPVPQAAAPQPPPPRPAAPPAHAPQPAHPQQASVPSMMGTAPAAPQSPAAQKPTFARPPAPPPPPPARPAPAPVPNVPAAPVPPPHAATGSAPATSTQGVPAHTVSVKLPVWTNVQLKQGEEAVAYKEDSKNPAIPAVLASLPVVLCAGAVFLGSMGIIVVGVLCVATFIVAFIMSKAAARRAVILTSQRAICILGKDRIELRK